MEQGGLIEVETPEQTGNGEVEVQGLGAPVPVRTRDSLVIVGFADGHRESAPSDSSTYELWGLNRLHVVMDRPWTRWFEIHNLDRTYGDGKAGGRDEQHIGWMKEQEIPIYVRPQDLRLARDWGIGSAEPFPVDALLASFPPYFTNSISYLIALGVLMEFPAMEIYGVDMAQDTLLQNEYSAQRPSCEFFLGVAMAAGIQVELPPGSDLLRSSHLYGIEDDTPMQQKRIARLNELGGRKEQLKQEMAQHDARQKELFAQINQLDGAMQDNQYWMRQLSAMPQE